MTLRFALLVLLASPVAAQAPSDLEQIEDVIGLYFQGHEMAVRSNFERAFHPDAQMTSLGDGGVRQTALVTWWLDADGQRLPNGTPADDEADRHRRIVSVDISGTMATAKLELDYPGALIHDYMTLIEDDGRWQIVHKAFVVHPR